MKKMKKGLKISKAREMKSSELLAEQ